MIFIRFYFHAFKCPIHSTDVTKLKSFVASASTVSHTHTTVLQLSGLCPGHPGWVGTRRNIHPLTLIVVISHPLSASLSVTIHGILPVQFTCLIVFFHNPSPSFLWSISWPGTLNFILHTFLYPIIVFYSQHLPISSHLFCCSTKIMSSNPSLSLDPLLGNLSCSLTSHIRLTILISAKWSATSFSFLTDQVSLPCNILLCTQLLYSLLPTIN